MDLKEMRRTCDFLVKGLRSPDAVDSVRLITTLCARMAERLGKPVYHRLVTFPPSTVTGLYVATKSANVVLCEQGTDPLHRLVITGHELWHMYRDHRSTPIAGDDLSQLLLATLESHTVPRIMAARQPHCTGPEELEAEYFAISLAAKVSQWLPEPTRPVPAHAAKVISRLEVSLGRETDRPHRG